MIEEDAQSEPVPSVETSPVETTSDAEIRATMGAVFDKAQASSSNDEFSRMPSDVEFMRNHEAPETDHSESGTDNADNTDTDHPPVSWKAEMHGVWSQLLPDAKAYIGQREAEMTRAISRFGEVASQASQVSERIGHELQVATEVSKVIESYRDSIPRTPDGQAMPPHSVLQHLLYANRMLNERPAETLQFLARSYGVDLAQLAQAPVDPIEQIQTQARQQIEQARQEERQALYAQLQQAQEQQAAQEQQQAAQEQQRAAYQQQLIDQIERFAGEKPYWSQIEPAVYYHAVALRSVHPDASPMEVVQEAHNRALREHADLDPKQQEKSKAAMAERIRKAEQAKRLASMNIRSRITSSASPGPTNKDLVSSMTDVYERIHGAF